MDFERLGAFYLGKEYNLPDRKLLDRLVMYDSRDLTTHAVCIGMTGSGKTGLCVGLLEEAAIDGVPAIIIDPKGDMTNRLLMFPELAPADFAPWINPDDARRKGMTADRKQADAEARKREAMLSVGESVIGVLLGRKSIRSGSTAASKYRQSTSAGMSAREAEENARTLSEEIQGLKGELEKESSAITARWEKAVEETVEVAVQPKKTGVEITSFLLAWVPHWQMTARDSAGNVRSERIDASR